MKNKSIGLILLLTLVLSLIPLAGVSAAVPTDEDFKEAAIVFMLEHHPELEAVDSDDWEFTLLGFTTRWFKMKFTYAEGPDEPPTYELDWVGVITWTKYWPLYGDISVKEVHYSYEVDLSVAKVGPGTTDPGPGVYTVAGGESYSFSASEAISEYPDEYYFRFVKWTIDDGVSVSVSYARVLSGVASTDLTITAVFETRYMSHCNVVYEDGLSAGYMWRDDHALLVVRVVDPSDVTVTIFSSYGTYNRTFHTGVRSFCIYFSAVRFVGDYTVVVSATNDKGTYSPKCLLAGLD